MKIPSWWPHDSQMADIHAPTEQQKFLLKNAELERVEKTLVEMDRKLDEMEERFTNLWLSISEYAGRIKSLENQLYLREAFGELRENKAKAIRRTIRFVRGENNADKRKRGKK